MVSSSTIRVMVGKEILEHVANIDVSKSGSWEIGAEFVDHSLAVGTEGNYQLVHRL